MQDALRVGVRYMELIGGYVKEKCAMLVVESLERIRVRRRDRRRVGNRYSISNKSAAETRSLVIRWTARVMP